MMKRLWLISAACFLLGLFSPLATAGELRSWGLVTVLQDEQGKAIGGLNIDDRLPPRFLRRPGALVPVVTDFPGTWQEVPHAPDPAIRLRLVESFWISNNVPPAAQSIRIAYPSGCPSAVYPQAAVEQPAAGRFSPLATGHLEWKDIRFVSNRVVAETDHALWLKQRQVSSRKLVVPGDDAETFLHHRALSNLDAPIRLQLDEGIGHLDTPKAYKLPVWAVQVEADGRLSFLSLSDTNRFSLAFSTASKAGPAFKAVFLEAARGQGMTQAEAEALWAQLKQSGFDHAGLRIVAFLPGNWIEASFPVSSEPRLPSQRNLLLCLQCVGPRERTILRRIAREKAIDFNVLGKTFWATYSRAPMPATFEELTLRDAPWRAFVERAGLPYPRYYDEYLSLGLYRNALLLNEQALRPSPNLKAWIAVQTKP